MVLFKGIQLGVGVVYPITGSYLAFERYTAISNRVASSNLNIGGFNVPINTLLKRATGEQTESIGNDERSLQVELLNLQKWLVYWMVYATIEVIANLLFLPSVLPAYNLLRCALSVWLVLPIVSQFFTKTPSDATLVENEWLKFTQQGCGLVYFQYLRPFMDSSLDENLPFDLSKLKAFSSKYTRQAAELITLVLNTFNANSAPSNSTNNTPGAKAPTPDARTVGVDNISSSAGHFFGLLRSYVPNPSYFQKPADTNDGSAGTTTTTTSSNVNVEDEYDVIDRPASGESTPLSQRQTSGSSDANPVPASSTGSERKRGWLW